MGNMKPNEFAEKLGVSVKTLQRWDNDGTLKAQRNPKGRRYYTEDQVMDYCTNGQVREKLIDALLNGYYDDFSNSEEIKELGKGDLLDLIRTISPDGMYKAHLTENECVDAGNKLKDLWRI